MEASTPFVSLRGILAKMGLKQSKWYIVNGLVMLATFFVFRVAMFPYVINLFAKAIGVDFFTVSLMIGHWSITSKLVLGCETVA